MQSLVETEIQPAPEFKGAASQPPPAATSRLPSLDGWRAVSILMVLGNHSTYITGFPSPLIPAFNIVFDGNLGVRFFFVISGFLITWLMILENDKNGTVSLREFYIRRCLRILPIYLAYLAVLAVLQFTGVDTQTPQAWLGNLTFTRNSFGFANEGDAVSAHLWSLSVEEQFYLAWPLIFFLFGRRADRSIFGILLVAILSATAIRAINYLNFYPAPFMRTFFLWNSLRYFDCLAFGCLGAVLFAHRREMIESVFNRRRFWAAAFGLALVLFPFYSMFLPLKPVTLAEFMPALRILGFSILLLQSIVAPDWGFYRTLNRVWIRQIGIWSYSIYVWQQLFWNPPHVLGLDRVWWMGVWIIPLLAVTLLSYYGLERPFFKLRSRHREVKFKE